MASRFPRYRVAVCHAGRLSKAISPVSINRICPKCRYLGTRDNGMFGQATPIIEDGGWTSRDTED